MIYPCINICIYIYIHVKLLNLSSADSSADVVGGLKSARSLRHLAFQNVERAVAALYSASGLNLCSENNMT